MTKPIMESPLFWPARLQGRTLYVLDETQIPSRLTYIKVHSTSEAVKVIREMKTRAFGQFLVLVYTFLLELKKLGKRSRSIKGRRSAKRIFDDRKIPATVILNKCMQTARAFKVSRPTFPFGEVTALFLQWASEAANKKQDVKAHLEKKMNGYLQGIRQRRLARVRALADLMQNGDCILTHCNVSGELAMAARISKEGGKEVQFIATETRPYLQGTRLTCWELKRLGIDVTLIADNAVGSVMADRLVSKVIVGSDRNCANGDFANKVGTYQIAVLNINKTANVAQGQGT